MSRYPQFFTRRMNQSSDGFTLLEILVVVLIIGILAAIAVSSWLTLLNNIRLKASQDQLYWAMREAQTKATQQKIVFQASFREQNNVSQWAIHRSTVSPETAQWQNLDRSVQIDPQETTLYLHPATRVWRIQFNHKGHPNGQIGRITVSRRGGGRTKRCVFVSTLLGAIRRASDRRQPQNGRYCY